MKKILRVYIQNVFDKSESIEIIENIRTAKDFFKFLFKTQTLKFSLDLGKTQDMF